MDLYLFIVPSIVALAAVALKKSYLTLRGAASAVFVGSAVAVADVRLFALLAVFFITSSAFTKLRGEWKRRMGLKDVTGRSLRQVVGVGAPIALFAVLYIATGDPKMVGAAATAVAVATADTWASEIGVAYGGVPRHVLAPWRRLPPGVSGGVTPIGVAASALGAAFIAILSAVLGLAKAPILVALLGYLGEFLDSVLGATLQIKYLCKDTVTEAPATGCVKRGFLTNESVNLISGLVMGFVYTLLS
ncbi:putative membrane protein [Pyrobaculum oguniense TE7]|uniref:Membrane protein n=1 Tax=Pyrobaculum oguniense (strain DSM 13380 / JCM 10595 / TE7) TaxID=698757 RepID=H6QD56_PYROT|nr:putative membrane protein [Pyrobaculum oguniense TE7]